MVFICVSLSRRAIQLSPLILTLATFLTPCHHAGRDWDSRRESVCAWLYTLGTPSGGISLAWLLLSEGPRLPSLALSPPCSLNLNLFSMFLPMGSHGWSGLGCYSGSSISLLFGHLSWLSPDAPWTPPWHLWYCQGLHCLPPHPLQCSLLPDGLSMQQVS